MKRIEFIAPVEAMRGNLGSDQDLTYGADQTSAYEAAAGKRNYANNYQPRFIGAKVSRTGLKYFAVKVRTAVKNTADWLFQCALMGVTAILYGIALGDLMHISQLQAQYQAEVANGYTGTFHKWLSNKIRECLAAKAATISIVGPSATVNLGNNPFSGATTAISIAVKYLVKFWKQLAPNGITFIVGNKEAICFTGSVFDDIIENSRINVLELSKGTVGSTDYVKMGDLWLKDDGGDYVDIDTEVTDGDVFTLTDVAPEP